MTVLQLIDIVSRHRRVRWVDPRLRSHYRRDVQVQPGQPLAAREPPEKVEVGRAHHPTAAKLVRRIRRLSQWALDAQVSAFLVSNGAVR